MNMMMYIACLYPNLVSVYFYAIPILDLHFKFPKFFYLLVSCHFFTIVSNNNSP